MKANGYRHCLFYLVVLNFLLAGGSCFQETIVPVEISVSYTVEDTLYQAPLQIFITNNTSGATRFQWTFEGGLPAASQARDPGVVTYPKGGTYTITVVASNEDETRTQSLAVTLYDKAILSFDAQVLQNNIAPVQVQLINTTVGGATYRWKFSEGTPSSFTGYAPPDVLFTTPGEHRIALIVENGPALDSLVKIITVQPALATAFEILPDFEDDDMEAPFHARLANLSRGGLTWRWTASGGAIGNITGENSDITITVPGTYTIALEASNGKETKTVTKEITIKPNSGLRTMTDIKLGINTAHATIGSFYSTRLRQVVSQQATDSLLQAVDLVFFGLNAGFGFNKFVSPDSVEQYTFLPIASAQTTIFINALEACACGITFTPADFDAMLTDAPLQNLLINATAEGSLPFAISQEPRIVLFRTTDQRKGAIKVKTFVQDGQQSYIVVDIKVQKL